MRPIKEYFSPKGRMARLEYFATMIAIGLLMYVPVLAGVLLTESSEVIGILLIVVGLVTTIWAQMCVVIKRAHDMNWSGASAFLMLIPLVNIVIGCLFMFKAGTDEGNNY